MAVRAKARKQGKSRMPNYGKHGNDVAAQSHSALLARLDGIAREVAELHAPKVINASLVSEGYPVCDGCDYSGWESEPPGWPCRTVRLLKAHARRSRRHVSERATP